MIEVGDLVRITKGQYNRHIGIVLDRKRMELIIKLPNSATIIKAEGWVELLGENND